MKKTSILSFMAAVLVSSCGTVAQWGASDDGQRFQDGIYSNSPSFRTKEEKETSKVETAELIAKTKESPIYLFGDKKDTILIPDNFSAKIQYDQKVGGTVVTVGENPFDWRWDLENRYGYYYGPYSLGSSWYWSRHYSPYYSSFWGPYWNSWCYSPWRYYSYYDPWYYDPWYYGGFYGGWYDPWYYGGFYGGYWGWHDPWHHYHHHVGWYDPYYHHGPSHIGGGLHHENRYYGLSAHTERNNLVTRNSGRSTMQTYGGTIRGGMSEGNTISRASRSVSSRSASLTRRQSGTISRPATVSRPASGSRVSAARSTDMTRTASTTNYRRPSTSSSQGQGSVTRESSGYSRSSSSYGSSSSSYNRGSSSGSYNRSSSSYGSSSSGNSYSRSSSGYSRSSSGGGSSSYSRSSSGSYRR